MPESLIVEVIFNSFQLHQFNTSRPTLNGDKENKLPLHQQLDHQPTIKHRKHVAN